MYKYKGETKMTKFIEVKTTSNELELLNIAHIIAVYPTADGCKILTTDLSTYGNINDLCNYVLESTNTYAEVKAMLTN